MHAVRDRTNHNIIGDLPVSRQRGLLEVLVPDLHQHLHHNRQEQSSYRVMRACRILGANPRYTGKACLCGHCNAHTHIDSWARCYAN